jgi:hypothetical protein
MWEEIQHYHKHTAGDSSSNRKLIPDALLAGFLECRTSYKLERLFLLAQTFTRQSVVFYIYEKYASAASRFIFQDWIFCGEI